MKRIKMTVAYDGTGYCGWQLQPNGVTIEEVLNGSSFRTSERSLFALSGPAGRTPVSMPWEMWRCLTRKAGSREKSFAMR